MSTKSVFCIANTRDKANRIVAKLKDAKFSNNDISLLFSDKETIRDFAREKNTQSPEGVVTGGGSVGEVDGALGWIAGVSALAIPDVGPFIAAGPIVAAFGGAAVTGFADGLTGMGIPAFEAERYEGKIKSGNFLLSVHADNDHKINHAKNIFIHSGAEDICTSDEVSVSQEEEILPVITGR